MDVSTIGNFPSFKVGEEIIYDHTRIEGNRIHCWITQLVGDP